MNDFLQKKCQSCVGNIEKINYADAKIYLQQIPFWQLRDDGLAIYRIFNFKNFKQTMFFINAVAFVCEQEGHHPDVTFSYNYCEIVFTSHELNALSENDFICAAKVNALSS